MNHGKKNGHFLLVLLVTLIWIECEGAWKGRQGRMPQTRIPTTNINRKLGPPSRRSIQPKLPTTEDQVEQAKTGRVSVHCVGGSISLPELRAHVFRRGFGTGGADLMLDETIDKMSLKLDRSDSEEYLHISNEPMFVSTQAHGSLGSTGGSDYVKVVTFHISHNSSTFLFFICCCNNSF